jgi:hypothetical protein
MDFKLVRDFESDDSVFGELLGDEFTSFQTVERLFDGVPKIPSGKYKCTRFLSPHLGYEVFMLNDVPYHDHILIHIANTWKDLDGCIGIGMERNMSEDMILQSKIAFDKFMAIQKDVQEFLLTV